MLSKKDIIKEFPNFFKIRYTLSYGDGWNHLVYNCLLKIQRYCIANSIDIKKVHVFKIKQKFGRLRINIDSMGAFTPKIYKDIQEILLAYEIQSLAICENCGKKGKLRNYDWIIVLCFWCKIKQIFKSIIN